MPKQIIDGGGGGGGGGGASVMLPQQQGVTISTPYELILENGMTATVYAEQRRIVLKTSLVRHWFMGAS